MSTRPFTVYVGLVLATLVALTLSTQHAHELLSARGAAAIAALIAFVKARYVALDFMELRGTVMQRAFDTWLLVVGICSLALVIRM